MLRELIPGQDRVSSDVAAEFEGALGAVRREQPAVRQPSWPPAHEEPLLFAVRFGDGPSRETFTFTPEGRRLPSAAEGRC